MLLVPLAVDDWRDFRGLDLGLSFPEDAGVEKGDTNFCEVGIDGDFVKVFERHAGFLGVANPRCRDDFLGSKVTLGNFERGPKVVLGDRDRWSERRCVLRRDLPEPMRDVPQKPDP
jgi:hypothetical protein